MDVGILTYFRRRLPNVALTSKPDVGAEYIDKKTAHWKFFGHNLVKQLPILKIPKALKSEINFQPKYIYLLTVITFIRGGTTISMEKT